MNGLQPLRKAPLLYQGMPSLPPASNVIVDFPSDSKTQSARRARHNGSPGRKPGVGMKKESSPSGAAHLSIGSHPAAVLAHWPLLAQFLHDLLYPFGNPSPKLVLLAFK